MANPLLDRALPTELAARGQVIELTEKIERFGRLVEIVTRDLAALQDEHRPRAWRAEAVKIRLEFGWADERGEIPSLVGTVETTLAAVCQRCLEPFGLEVRASLKALLVSATEDGVAGDEFEVWELDEGAIRPVDLVEEALVMALPLAATHPTGERCVPPAAADESGSADTVRPFADLRRRMNETNE